uniref:Uncharacterized protein n=1 Tax=Rhizochromulina marina TaxID=1034831 RepID=A0A7S2SH94_9STRA
MARRMLWCAMVLSLCTGWQTPPVLRQSQRLLPAPPVQGRGGGPLAVLHDGVRHVQRSDERDGASDYELAVGRAIDAVRADVPRILLKEPNLDIFRKDIKLSDPSGLKLQGIRVYKQLHRLIRSIGTMSLTSDSTVTARLWYDKSQGMLKCKVNAQLMPHGNLFGDPFYLNFVSLYYFDANGDISHHVIQRVDLDGNEFDALRWLTTDSEQLMGWLGGRRIPVAQGIPGGVYGNSPASVGPEASDALALSVLRIEDQDFDVYGNIIPPSSDKSDSRKADGSRKPKKNVFLDWLKQLEPEWCEDNLDCPGSQACCDFGVTKVCCNGGIGAHADSDELTELVPQLVPIPVPSNDGYPPQPPQPW